MYPCFFKRIAKYTSNCVKERSQLLVQTIEVSLTKILCWYQFYWQCAMRKPAKNPDFVHNYARGSETHGLSPFSLLYNTSKILEKIVGCSTSFPPNLLFKALSNLFTKWLFAFTPQGNFSSQNLRVSLLLVNEKMYFHDSFFEVHLKLHVLIQTDRKPCSWLN